jgi:hypothetical protein
LDRRIHFFIQGDAFLQVLELDGSADQPGNRPNVTVTSTTQSIAPSNAVIVPSGRCEKIDFADFIGV